MAHRGPRRKQYHHDPHVGSTLDGMIGTGIITAIIAAPVLTIAASVGWVQELDQDRRVDLLNQSAAAGCVRGVNEVNGSDGVITICKTVFANTAQRAEDRDIIGLREMNTSKFNALRITFEQRAYQFGNKTALSSPNPSADLVVSFKEHMLKNDDPIYTPS